MMSRDASSFTTPNDTVFCRRRQRTVQPANLHPDCAFYMGYLIVLYSLIESKAYMLGLPFISIPSRVRFDCWDCVNWYCIFHMCCLSSDKLAVKDLHSGNPCQLCLQDTTPDVYSKLLETILNSDLIPSMTQICLGGRNTGRSKCLSSSSSGREWLIGPRGGEYYLTEWGTKVYRKYN